MRTGRKNFSGSLRKKRWINELLKAGLTPVMNIIEEGDDDKEWQSREKYWIVHYRSIGCDLFNLREGGGGGPTAESHRRSGLAGWVTRRANQLLAGPQVKVKKRRPSQSSTASIQFNGETPTRIIPCNNIHLQVPTRIDILAKKVAEGNISQKEQAVYKWITANFGMLTKVAQECGVSSPTVHLVAMNKRKSAGSRVERTLRDLGCPILQRIN